MKPGAKPLSERATTGAERLARYRTARAQGAPVVRFRKPKERRSRGQRWRDAVAERKRRSFGLAAWDVRACNEQLDVFAASSVCSAAIKFVKAIAPSPALISASAVWRAS
jgi:hypothetical protein